MPALVVLFMTLLSVLTARACPLCGGEEPKFKNLPYPACSSEVELVKQNSNAYGPEDIRRILPFIRQANKKFYKCGKFEIAVGKDITVIIDTESGIIYLTRFVFEPEEN